MRTAGKVVLQLAGQFDEAAIGQFEREFTYWMNRGEKTLVIDFESVELVRKDAVRSVLFAGRQLEQLGGSLVLCGVSGAAGRAFRMYGVDGLFESYENLEEFEDQTRKWVTQ